MNKERIDNKNSIRKEKINNKLKLKGNDYYKLPVNQDKKQISKIKKIKKVQIHKKINKY